MNEWKPGDPLYGHVYSNDQFHRTHASVSARRKLIQLIPDHPVDCQRCWEHAANYRNVRFYKGLVWSELKRGWNCN